MPLHFGCDRARVVSSRTLSGGGYEDPGGQIMFARVGDKMDELNSIVKCYFRIRTENMNASFH